MFQSAISSTPFSGTMAETSTETPAGTLPQTPVANEMPGASGDRARAEKLKSPAALDAAIKQFSDLLQWLDQRKWSRHPNSKNWQEKMAKWQRLGLSGNEDREPPEMMYQRVKAMTDVAGKLQTLLEEKRILESPGPGEAAALDTKGREQEKAAAAAIERERRTATVSEIEKLQGHPMDPNVRAQFIEGGYGLDKAAGEQDPIKAATAAAELGAKAGDVSGDPTIPAPMRSFVGAGAKQGARVRAEKKESDADSKKYAGYPDLKSLRVALNATYDRYADTLKTEVEGVGMVVNPRSLLREKGVVISKELTPEAARKARQMALDQFDGAETIPELKNYVEGKQQDITPAQQTKKLLDARKAKAK